MPLRKSVVFAQQSVGAQPVIEGGAAITNKSTVRLSFTNITGIPNQIRWRWGAPPTDAATDSNGWVSFANALDASVPSWVLNNPFCSPVVLYTQLRNTNVGLVQSPPGQASIIVDTLIQATERVENPYLPRPGAFTPLTTAWLADTGSSGASDGDPGYTRVPVFYLGVDGSSDCSGLQTVGIGRDAGHIATFFNTEQSRFANVVPLPGNVTSGMVSIAIRVQDRAGNSRTTEHSLIYDVTRPVWNSGTVSLGAANPQATILTTLSFSGINAIDNLYPGGFWGIWVANSRQPIADPMTDPSLTWTPLKVSQPNSAFTIPGWSLTTGLRADAITPGNYYVYVRLLDGAGNPSDSVRMATTVLDAISYPPVYLPLVKR